MRIDTFQIGTFENIHLLEAFFPVQHLETAAEGEFLAAVFTEFIQIFFEGIGRFQFLDQFLCFHKDPVSCHGLPASMLQWNETIAGKSYLPDALFHILSQFPCMKVHFLLFHAGMG